MDLIRDVLDKKVVDRHGREMGRVDAVVLEIRDNAPPSVAALELGPAILADRVHPVFGRIAIGLEHACGIATGRPLRIPFRDILSIKDHIRVDLAFGDTVAAEVEKRLRTVIGSIPGSS